MSKLRFKTLAEMQADNLVRFWSPEQIERWLGRGLERGHVGGRLADGCFVQFDAKDRFSCLPAPTDRYGRRVRVSDFWSEFFPGHFVSKYYFNRHPEFFVEEK